jgi:hypothetical protein
MPTEPLAVPYRKSIEAHHRDLLCAFRSSQILPYKPPTPKQNCHPDRSAAKWRDLQFHSRTQRISRMQRTISHLPFTVESDGYLSEVLSIHIANATQSTTLPFVIPTEAQRSGGICSAPFGPPESSVTHPSAQTELSSRPQRSEVEGPAVSFRHKPTFAERANLPFVIPTEAQRSGGICSPAPTRNESRECNEPFPICP